MNKYRRKNTSNYDGFYSFIKDNTGWVCFFVIVLVLLSYSIYWSSLKDDTYDIEEIASIEEEQTEIVVLSDDDYDMISSLGIMLQQQIRKTPEVSNIPSIQNIPHVSKLKKLSRGVTYEEQLPHDIVEHKRILPKNKKARIAIVVDDMGGSIKRTKEITDLHAPLTASFLTFAPKLNEQVVASQNAGHEIMIHVPMQPQSNIYVSEDVLKIDMTDEQISNTFAQMLSKFKSIKGINNHMGSRFTEHSDKLVPVMKLLAQNNLFFLDSKTTPKSQVEQVAEKYNVPYVHRHVFLDNNNDFDYIMKQLKLTEQIAIKNGYAIAICHPKSQTSKALKEWLNSLSDKNIELVPLSVLVSDYS